MFSYIYKVYENNRLYFFKSLKEILFSFVQPRCPVRDRHIYLSISFKIDFCFPTYLSLIKYFMRIIFEKKQLSYCDPRHCHGSPKKNCPVRDKCPVRDTISF